jgi:CHAD domain-containing protein
MSDTGFIYTYWKKQQQLFNNYFSCLKKYPATDAVREIRTTIKKLRATLRLYVLMTEEKLLKYPLTQTEDFFTVIGSQRDIEVSLETLKSFEKDAGSTHPQLKRCLRSLLDISLQWTSKAVQQYKKKELGAVTLLLKSESSTIDDEKTKEKLVLIIETALVDCKNYFKQPHKLRQHLKEIYYWIKMGQESSLVEISYTEALHEILKLFGDWRNRQVFKTRIRHIRKDHLPKSFAEYEPIKIIEKKAAEEAEELLKTALVQTRQLLKKIGPKK